MTPPSPPAVVTLQLDPASFQRLDALRKHFFPPDRNFVPAHISLFHALPGDQLLHVKSILAEVSSQTEEFDIAVSGLRSLGRGVAYVLASGALQMLRGTLARGFAHWLTPQDRQRFQPHVTIQNKVTPGRAAETLRLLQSDFQPFTVRGLGICLWAYESGPWRPLERFTFRSLDTDG